MKIAWRNQQQVIVKQPWQLLWMLTLCLSLIFEQQRVKCWNKPKHWVVSSKLVLMRVKREEGVGNGTLSHQWHSDLPSIMLIPFPPLFLPLWPAFRCTSVLLGACPQGWWLHMQHDGASTCPTAPPHPLLVSADEDTLNGLFSAPTSPFCLWLSSVSQWMAKVLASVSSS